MNAIDTKQHLRASRPWQSLGNGKEFLILWFALELSFFLVGQVSYHLLVDPFVLFYEELVELLNTLSMQIWCFGIAGIEGLDLLFENALVARQRQ